MQLLEEVQMQHQHKAAKITRKEDRFFQLPDGILMNIVSKLTLKEAVRTSILSKDWRYIWTCHRNLYFDSITVLGSRAHFQSIYNGLPESDRQLKRCKFVQQVDHLMRERDKGLKINSFAIHFHLGEDFASYLSDWVNCAVTKGAENIDLTLSEWCSFKVNSEPSTQFALYTFPSSVLAAFGKRCTVKHLQLACCILSSPSNYSSLTSLISVELRDVNISDEELKHFVSSCSLLETLKLCFCNCLANFKYSSTNSNLKFLSLRNCLRLQSIEIDAENLNTLEYTGELVGFSFKNIPALLEVFLCFTGKKIMEGVAYALERVAHDIPQLKNLNVLSVLALRTLQLSENAPTFTNVKLLVLTLFPFHDEDKLNWVTYILKAFPLLCDLELNLFSPNYISNSETERLLPKCPHSHLNRLEINGFFGNEHEVELLKYILDNVLELKVLVVSTSQKKYKGFNCWNFEEVPSYCKLRLDSIKWLRENLSPTILLQVK